MSTNILVYAAEVLVVLNAHNLNVYLNVDGQSVAKQRLGKQTSTTERLFSMGSAPRPFSKHVSTIEAVFSAWSGLKVYRGQRRSLEVSSR
jgi:hypothetical protein